MSVRIDIAGTPEERFVFAVSPLAELTAMLHVLAAPEHHPHLAGWVAGVTASFEPDLSERLRDAAFLWRSSRPEFLVPARPRATLAEELDDLDALDDDRYVTSALTTTCGTNRLFLDGPSPLADTVVRDRALGLARARGARPEAFARELLADPPAMRARIRLLLEGCGFAFFDAVWPEVGARLAAEARSKTDLRVRQGLEEALLSLSPTLSLDGAAERIIVDKLDDSATSARDRGVTFIPSVYGHPHMVVICAPGWVPVVQYPIGAGATAESVSLEEVRLRLEALANPTRLRLVRTLARGPHTTCELAWAWDLTPPEVSRHLTVLRRAGLLTSCRSGRYVHYTLDLTAAATLGTDLLDALLR